jgi:uncharacterized tellurite resistance protein B-like protein
MGVLALFKNIFVKDKKPHSPYVAPERPKPVDIEAQAKPVVVQNSSGKIEQDAMSVARDELYILRWAAMADGEMQDVEYDIIKAYAADRMPTLGLSEAEMQKNISWVIEQHPTQDEVYAACFRVSVDTVSAKNLRQHVQKLIKSDGTLDEGEIEVMRLVCKFFAEAEAMNKVDLANAIKEQPTLNA